MSDVTLNDVRVRREGRLVLDVPSLRLRGRRITAILGPNGSGKTTLLRVIAGLERGADGKVQYGGSGVQAHDVAYAFQESVFLRGSVRDNLALALRLRGLQKAETRRRIEDALALLGVTDLLDRRTDRLSGGEARRVSLARALCLRAPLVLLDEPLAGLDGRAYAQLVDDLPDVLAALNATTLLVTHSHHEALRLAQDLAVLVDGRIRACGDANEIAMNPRTTEVATTLGYTVVRASRGTVAVPAGALKLGAGTMEFSMTVERVIETIDGTEVVGRIGHVRVRALCAGSEVPMPGAHITVSADRCAEVV